MKQTRQIMGMPVILEVVDPVADQQIFDEVFDYFGYVDRKFSPFKEDSELSRINKGELALEDSSEDMRAIFRLAEETRQETDGYFQIERAGRYDPSGIVKGWAIQGAAELLRQAGYENYSVYAGGDIQVSGKNELGEDWQVGIQNPFDPKEIVKVLRLQNCGVATSGTYERGQHIYNPKVPDRPIDEIVSLTVIGPNIYEADRFATAAFAMGAAGINLIENLEGL